MKILERRFKATGRHFDRSGEIFNLKHGSKISPFRCTPVEMTTMERRNKFRKAKKKRIKNGPLYKVSHLKYYNNLLCWFCYPCNVTVRKLIKNMSAGKTAWRIGIHQFHVDCFWHIEILVSTSIKKLDV
jgi:hypothetical protein